MPSGSMRRPGNGPAASSPSHITTTCSGATWARTGGYDSGLGDPRFRFGPTNTGLLVWYNNNFYSDNEIFNYLTDYPGFGPKGKMLVVDSHPEPYRYPDLLAARL